MMWNKIRPYVGFSAAALAVGGLSALLTGGGMRDFAALNQPPLSPPAWLFPVVWTILYTLMGVAAWRIWQSSAPGREAALGFYIAQLVFNFFWPLLYFGAELFGAALVWLLALWVLILLTIRKFSAIDRTAGRLLIPYLLWVTFAVYLNAGVWILNR